MTGPIRIAILANGGQARREIDSVNRSLGGFSKIGRATGLGLATLTGGLAAFAVSSVNAERQFSTSMRLMQASTGATGDEMQQMNDLAIKLGQDTSFSANEAASAMLELAKAGLDTKTIMGGGVAGTLTLAAAGGTDLATAATIASNALNTFNLSGREMDDVAAALAGGANASTASVESLGQALQQVGPGATNAGLSLQETVAALAAFDQAGIKGSDAGTSLKTMLTRLVPSTAAASNKLRELGLDFTNADGSFKSLTEIAAQLTQGMSKLSDEQRVAALNTIFGSDAARAATVLFREGAGGIREYIKASSDNAAAQEAAAARLGGTEGALERLSGAVETAKLRLGQELAPAIIAGSDALDDKLVPAIETGIDVVKDLGEALAPAAQEIGEALGNLAGEGDEVGRIFEGVVLPAIRETAEIVGFLVDVVDDLPGPVKEIGVQAGVAALVLPRFTAAVTATTGAVTTNVARLKQLRAELTYTETRAQVLSGTMTRLGGAARTAAGVGGMVGLTQAASTSNKTLGTLISTASGAALGFSMGGPWGAAIGAVGGLVTGLATAGDETDSYADSVARTKERVDAFAQSLNESTGALTTNTRALALQRLEEEGAVTAATRLGVSTRDLVSATLGNEAAIRRVQKAYQQTFTGGDSVMINGQLVQMQGNTTRLTADSQLLADVIGDVTREVRSSVKQRRMEILATQDLSALYKKLPPRAVTHIESKGLLPTTRGIARLARQYDLTPKQIRTVIQETGAETSRRKVLELIRQLDNAEKGRKGKVTVDVGAARNDVGSLGKLLDDTGKKRPKPRAELDDNKAREQTNALIQLMEGLAGKKPTPNADVNTTDALRAILSLEARMNLIPDEDVWINIRERNVGGGGGGAGSDDAPGSGREQGRETGREIATGIEEGLAGREQQLARTLKGVVARALGSVTDGKSGVSSALDKLTALIEKKVDLKNDKKERAREKRILGHLADEYTALLKNGKAQDAVNRKLEKARQHLQEVQAWADQVKQTFIDTGNIVNLGGLEDGTVSGTLLLDQLRAQVEDARRFAALIRELTAAGLNDTSLEQLLAAGPEAGIATAEALAAGGQAAIDEINALTEELAQTGSSLADEMSDEFFKVGLSAAQGLVEGLEDRAEQLDKIAERLADKLIKQVRKALGINSPSRVFAEIGDQTVRGLAIGLDDTYVKRSGVALADSLVKGFGTPALDAFLQTGSSSSTPVPLVRVRLSAEQVSRAQRGQEILLDIDAARASGSRQLAVRGA